jgi:cell division protein FtsL
MMSGLSCAILMRTLLRLSLHVEILIICSTRLSLRNLESLLMIVLLVLSLLLAAYVHVELACVSLKGKIFHATKENTELQQEVAYLTARLEKTC